MQSHSYRFAKGELIQILFYPLIPLILFAVLMQGGAQLDSLPKPIPALDTDRTIVLHQAVATELSDPAKILLIGDSSCLMDVAAYRLTGCSGPGSEALNLATLSYLNLQSYRTLLQHYFAHNTNSVRTVVLLMHPEALRQAGSDDYYSELVRRYYLGQDFCPPNVSPISCWLGAEIFRERILARTLPLPLAGAYGRKYGFTFDLWKYLSAHRGSAIDPGVFDPSTARGNSEYRLAASLEVMCRDFAGVIPKKIQLLVGITPIPESQIPPGYQKNYDAMLKKLGEWLEVDASLSNLPPVLPDKLFATKTHLNEEGQRQFTEMLCALMARPER
jgi:hypothetical protein